MYKTTELVLLVLVYCINEQKGAKFAKILAHEE